MTAELLSAAAREDGQTVLCATHDERLLALADNIVDLTHRATAPGAGTRGSADRP